MRCSRSSKTSPSTLPAVGLDLGVACFATLSDGTVIRPLAAFERLRRRVARSQRELARKKPGSRNRAKQRRRLAKLRRRERRARHDFLHKSSTRVARHYGTVVMEALPVRVMTASASGTADAPGRQVRVKAGLNRAILDQDWYQFKRLLGYKLAECGGTLVLVDPSFTSQRCAACGHVEAENRESQAVFRCLACGHHDHADHNAAVNILVAAGHAVPACGGIRRKPPVEAATQREAVSGPPDRESTATRPRRMPTLRCERFEPKANG